MAQDIQRRLSAIRRLSRAGRTKGNQARLDKIAEIASGKGDVDSVFKAPKLGDLGKRLAEGQASRSPMATDPKPEKEEKKKKRTEKEGRDRKDRSGRDRGE